MASPAQSPTTAWVQSLRRDVRDADGHELAKVAHVGFVMATFANADGTSIKSSQELLAKLTGRSVEAVSRSIRIMVAAQILRARRRPNKSTEYQLVIPPYPPNWPAILNEIGESRHQTRYRKAKTTRFDAEPVQALDPAQTRIPDYEFPGYPDTESARTPEGSDTEFARGRTPSLHGVRTPSLPGGTSTYLPPVDTSTADQDTPPLSPQQPVRAGAREAKDESPGEEPTGWAPCPTCGSRMLLRPGRQMCTACIRTTPTS